MDRRCRRVYVVVRMRMARDSRLEEFARLEGGFSKKSRLEKRFTS